MLELRIRKRPAMFVSIAVGLIIFTTTAMAEIASKSGYDQLKDSLKFTAESCSSKLSSFTGEMSFVLKDNGKVIVSQDSVIKYDVSKNAMENTSTSVEGTNAKEEGYYYSDKNSYITHSNSQDIYYLTESTEERKGQLVTNPFKEQGAGDMEKIADALIGNLKDSVVVTENADGSKDISGSISEAQIPAVVNAVVSFGFKRQFASTSVNTNAPSSEQAMAKITKDIFVKEIKGKIVVGKDGLIQSILGTGTLSGKDEQGNVHNLTFELLGKLVNVNSTVVSKPDLTGKKVEKSVQKDYNKLTNPGEYSGKYKNDIIIEKDGKFQKIGEKIVDITQIDDKTVSGTYHEEFKAGYEDYAANKSDFSFNGKFDDNKQGSLNANFTVKDSKGKNYDGGINFNPYSPNINFWINKTNNNVFYDNGQYNKVFD